MTGICHANDFTMIVNKVDNSLQLIINTIDINAVILDQVIKSGLCILAAQLDYIKVIVWVYFFKVFKKNTERIIAKLVFSACVMKSVTELANVVDSDVHDSFPLQITVTGLLDALVLAHE
jgi:hypothetical protein